MAQLNGRHCSWWIPQHREDTLCSRRAQLGFGWWTTPCGNDPTTQSTKTDANGEFEFSDLPLSTYGFAAKLPTGKWVTSFKRYGKGAGSGQTFDVGSLVLTERNLGEMF